MGFFEILTILGGLALFLYGMELMGEGLSRLTGGRLERLLGKMTESPFKALSVGVAVTAVVQSSSAVTVMAVGFVDSGMMCLEQAAGVIMGANVGTTVTSWILVLAGIDSEVFFLQLFQPIPISMVSVALGVVMLAFARRERYRAAAKILVGLAALLFGMELMRKGVAPLADVPEFAEILTRFSSPVLCLAAGTALTAVIQSSSASVGMLQALCLTGAVSYRAAVPVILGQNIGTCVTAMLSCVGASINAKRTAFLHLYFNAVGAALCMGLFYPACAADIPFLQKAASPFGIAAIHSLFNVVSTVCLFPFSSQLVRLTCMTIKEQPKPLQPVRKHQMRS